MPNLSSQLIKMQASNPGDAMNLYHIYRHAWAEALRDGIISYYQYKSALRSLSQALEGVNDGY